MARRPVNPKLPVSPKLPSFLDRKIYKTGQTRGADDDDILQNRVARNSTALFPYRVWNPATCFPPDGTFERGYTVLISPADWRAIEAGETQLSDPNLSLGVNLLVFYQTRQELDHYPPHGDWVIASRRFCPPERLGAGELPLLGHYVARVAATTGNAGERIAYGFTETTNKGAGIQGMEYASERTSKICRLQLEALVWMTEDSIDALSTETRMARDDAERRRELVMNLAQEHGLLDMARLSAARIIDAAGFTVCPLCLKRLHADGFMSRLPQAAGRETLDLTVTQINLFHIEEVRYGAFNHRAYKLGWGCHHCNATVRDLGIRGAIEWMRGIVAANTGLLNGD